MHLYLCLDPNGGLRFNRRRQSRDSAVCEDILQCANGAPLHMTEHSKKLFSDNETNIICSETPLERAESGEHCFVECLPLSPFLERFETVTIYRWNRVYPADEKLDIDPFTAGFALKSVVEFAGTSHEIITKEVYTR